MIETREMRASLNSAPCFQIEKFFDGLAAVTESGAGSAYPPRSAVGAVPVPQPQQTFHDRTGGYPLQARCVAARKRLRSSEA
jgi:hypothetical protein